MAAKEIIDELLKLDKECHYFNTLDVRHIDLQIKGSKKIKTPSLREGKLSGQFVPVKDAICVKDVESRAGSSILDGYQPVFDATVISRIKKAGGVIAGKTSQDAFGFGSFNVNVGLRMKVPLNPHDKTRCTGGSSGGSCGIVASSKHVSMALAESTGGSIVAPAAYCGVFGLCPTYGRVSRYGLMDYANSLDKIGPVGKTVKDVALLLEVIAGHDEKDSTSLDAPVSDYTSFIGKKVKGMKIGVIKDAFGKGVDKNVSSKVKDAIASLQKAGCKVEEVSLPLTFKYGIEAYYLLAASEASTNLAKYCGMRYGKHEKLSGNFNEYFTSVRSKHFNEESKRRIILGTFARMSGFRDAYYLKAAKVRTLIIQEYKKLFKQYDVLISPTMPNIAPKFSEIKKMTPLEHYMMDIMTVGPNLAGLPHLNVPVGLVKKMPVGMLVIGDHLQEGKLMQIGSLFDAELI